MLRASEEALWRGDYEELSRQTVGGANVLVFVRRSRSGALLVVLGNDDEAREVSVPLGSHPAWHDESVLEGLLGGGAPPRVAVREQRIVLTVPPKTAAIYRASATPH